MEQETTIGNKTKGSSNLQYAMHAGGFKRNHIICELYIHGASSAAVRDADDRPLGAIRFRFFLDSIAEMMMREPELR